MSMSMKPAVILSVLGMLTAQPSTKCMFVPEHSIAVSDVCVGQSRPTTFDLGTIKDFNLYEYTEDQDLTKMRSVIEFLELQGEFFRQHLNQIEINCNRESDKIDGIISEYGKNISIAFKQIPDLSEKYKSKCKDLEKYIGNLKKNNSLMELYLKTISVQFNKIGEIFLDASNRVNVVELKGLYIRKYLRSFDVEFKKTDISFNDAFDSQNKLIYSLERVLMVFKYKDGYLHITDDVVFDTEDDKELDSLVEKRISDASDSDFVTMSFEEFEAL